MRIIIGLGNPGKKYAGTRHNAGFMAVDRLAARQGWQWEKNKKFEAEIARGSGMLLMKPLTYMNNSGQAARKILSYYKLLPKTFGIVGKSGSDLTDVLTVIHDDLDIRLGKKKTALDSRSAGHNGVESIIAALKTKKFKRIRIGIGREAARPDAQKYVLQKFAEDEIVVILRIIDEILQEI